MAELSSTSVKLVEVCRVAPQPQPDVAEFSLPQTFFDLLWLRFPHFHRLFFYEILASSASADTKPFFDSLLFQKLKASLSVTLQHFLPLAGNIIWPQDSHKPVLSYVQGDAVSLTTAHSDADFHRLSSNDFNIEAKEYHPLVPQLAISREKAAVMAFQITLFTNSSGFSIGISMHHAALDGKTLFMFLKSWAHLCKHEPDTLLPDQLKPFYDRRVFIQDPAGLELEAIYLNQFLNMDQRPNNRSLMVATRYKSLALPDSIRGTFEFTSTKIEALRQSVMIKKHQQYHQSVLNLSTFCLTCAYTWVCLVKAEEEEEEEEEEIKDDQILMVLSVDCRSRLDPPIPATYFGNCITGHGAFAERKGLLGEDGFFVAVNAISEAIKGLNNGVLNGAENLVSSLYLSESDLQATTDHSRVFTTAGSHQFKMYDTDFGWGRPKSTEVVPIGRRGAITFSDGKNGGGAVDIGLVLKKHHMEVFASLFPKGLQNL
ncbi:PREDICTED: phenolic glucoside malonyltransferase 1-like [Prunus mume]|uniref:Phenolic glucoside malonyltransferase 1-like n=1 Tax=Prunus mume TaxID=102107 RepID=A0ABM0NWL5_PRUMU|nr:PREDICTED: phenolic glucoside malonyltransferase 1-like [Prunus mume]